MSFPFHKKETCNLTAFSVVQLLVPVFSNFLDSPILALIIKIYCTTAILIVQHKNEGKDKVSNWCT